VYVGGSVQEPGHYSAVRGMERAAERVSLAAQGISESAMHSVERSGQAIRGPSSVEGAGPGPAAVVDLDRWANELTMGDHAYRANVRSARASDAQFQQLVDMALPEGYSRLVDAREA
jgi:hypothetical protein